MAADLHIHVLTDEFTEEHYKAFVSHTLGSKYCRLHDYGYAERFEKERACDLFALCGDTPQIWVGEVSWLKADVFGEAERFIPDPISSIVEVIGEDFPMIDDALIERIRAAIAQENKTNYSLAKGEDILRWLEEHKGRKAFTISW